MNLTVLTKKSISALEMKRQLGMKRYEPVLCKMGKLRIAMGDRDQNYEFQGDVELDDAFITVICPEKNADPLKRGRGSQRKKSILVMVSTTKSKLKSRKNRPKTAPRFLKLIAMDELTSSQMNHTVFENVRTDCTTIKSYAFRGFGKLKQVLQRHKAKVTPAKKAHVHLPWFIVVLGI
jgi:hypothetical protein